MNYSSSEFHPSPSEAVGHEPALFGQQVYRLHENFGRLMATVMRSNPDVDPELDDMNLSEKRLLMNLGMAGPMKMSELARQMGLTMSGATAIVDRAVRAGIVLREAAEDDRRVVRVRFSPRGAELFEKCNRCHEAMWVRALSRMSEADRAELVQVFERAAVLMSQLELQPEKGAENQGGGSNG